MLPCSSIRPMLRPPRPHCGRYRKLPAPSGCKSKSSMPARSGEIDAAFATLERERPDALFVAPDAFFTSRRVQFVTLAARDRIPAAYTVRDIVAAGGLMSYGTDFVDSFRQVGVYTGKILKGAKPADLPVEQSTKFEFVINLKTAKALGIDVPPTLLATRRRGDRISAPAASWCDPAGVSPAQVRVSVRLVASVAWPLATAVAKRTQQLHGVWD